MKAELPATKLTSQGVYGSVATYRELPDANNTTKGVVPLDTLPAAWWNALWNAAGQDIDAWRAQLASIRAEISNVLAAAMLTPSDASDSQLLSAIQTLRKTIATATVAGAVTSGSDIKEVSVDPTTGKMSVNAMADWADNKTIATRLSEQDTTIADAIDAQNSDIADAVDSINTIEGRVNTAINTTIPNAVTQMNSDLEDGLQEISDSVDDKIKSRARVFYMTCSPSNVSTGLSATFANGVSASNVQFAVGDIIVFSLSLGTETIQDRFMSSPLKPSTLLVSGTADGTISLDIENTAAVCTYAAVGYCGGSVSTFVVSAYSSTSKRLMCTSSELTHGSGSAVSSVQYDGRNVYELYTFGTFLSTRFISIDKHLDIACAVPQRIDVTARSGSIDMYTGSPKQLLAGAINALFVSRDTSSGMYRSSTYIAYTTDVYPVKLFSADLMKMSTLSYYVIDRIEAHIMGTLTQESFTVGTSARTSLSIRCQAHRDITAVAMYNVVSSIYTLASYLHISVMSSSTSATTMSQLFANSIQYRYLSFHVWNANHAIMVPMSTTFVVSYNPSDLNYKTSDAVLFSSTDVATFYVPAWAYAILMIDGNKVRLRNDVDEMLVGPNVNTWRAEGNTYSNSTMDASVRRAYLQDSSIQTLSKVYIRSYTTNATDNSNMPNSGFIGMLGSLMRYYASLFYKNSTNKIYIMVPCSLSVMFTNYNGDINQVINATALSIHIQGTEAGLVCFYAPMHRTFSGSSFIGDMQPQALRISLSANQAIVSMVRQNTSTDYNTSNVTGNINNMYVTGYIDWLHIGIQDFGMTGTNPSDTTYLST